VLNELAVKSFDADWHGDETALGHMLWSFPFNFPFDYTVY